MVIGRDTEEREEQWLVFQESIAVTSSVKMPRPSPGHAHSQPGPALSSPVKIETTTSAEALKVRGQRLFQLPHHVLPWLQIELGIVQSAIKSGHKDPGTVQKERQVDDIIHCVSFPLFHTVIPLDTS